MSDQVLRVRGYLFVGPEFAAHVGTEVDLVEDLAWRVWLKIDNVIVNALEVAVSSRIDINGFALLIALPVRLHQPPQVSVVSSADALQATLFFFLCIF